MNTNELPGRLPTRPLRTWLLAWRIWTGDPPGTIARGFDIDEATVAELLSSRPPLMWEASAALTVCSKLRLAPNDIWPRSDLRFRHDPSAPIAEEEGLRWILLALSA